MLFMVTYSFEPAQMNEVMKRRTEKGRGAPADLKVLNEWIVPGALKGFMLCEASDCKALLAGAGGWSDLMKSEIVPVMEAEEALKMAPPGIK